MIEYLLTYVLHVCVWFIVGALAGMVRGRGAVKLGSAIALAVFSFVAQIIIEFIYL